MYFCCYDSGISICGHCWSFFGIDYFFLDQCILREKVLKIIHTWRRKKNHHQKLSSIYFIHRTNVCGQYIIVAVLLLGLFVKKVYHCSFNTNMTIRSTDTTIRCPLRNTVVQMMTCVHFFFLSSKDGESIVDQCHTACTLFDRMYADHYEELYDRLQDVTTLDAYREYPYVFGQYLIPGTTQINTQSVDNALSFWYKWLQTL